MRSEYIAAMFLGLCILAASLLLRKHNHEVDKQIKNAIDSRDMVWAKAVDSIIHHRDKGFELYERIIDEKNVVIVEQQKRIEELENQIAVNNAVMSLVNVTDQLRGEIQCNRKKELKD